MPLMPRKAPVHSANTARILNAAAPVAQTVFTRAKQLGMEIFVQVTLK